MSIRIIEWKLGQGAEEKTEKELTKLFNDGYRIIASGSTKSSEHIAIAWVILSNG